MVEQSLGEPGKVLDGGVAATGGGATVGQSVGVRAPLAAWPRRGVADGAVRDGFGLRQRAGGGHSCRLANVLVHVGVVGLPGYRFDDGAEQHEAVVAVRPPRASAAPNPLVIGQKSIRPSRLYRPQSSLASLKSTIFFSTGCV